MTSVVSGLPDAAALRGQVTAVLDGFLEHKAGMAAGLRMPAEVTEYLRDFLAVGGKRLRPLLCATGWHAAYGHGMPKAVVRTAASLEMFHTFCLIHDDVMDDSGSRRGAPTLHRRLTQHHRNGRAAGAAERVGAGAAILIGDLALAWSHELLHTAGLTPAQLDVVLPLIDDMRSEVMYGQYLDITTAGQPTTDVDQALRIARYKTAKYTVERPLHIGAALADASLAVHEALSAYALPLGEAFQLRDDLLGVFGSPQTTGKPALDDLREGKHTALVALTLQHASRTQADHLHLILGCPTLTEEQAEEARHIITASGARHAVEEMITTRHEQALTALASAPLAPVAIQALTALADTIVRRDS